MERLFKLYRNWRRRERIKATARRMKELTADFDAMIARAQSKHQPVEHLKRAKTAYVHSLLVRQ